MSNIEVVCFSTPSNIRKKIDRIRGDVSRSRFITRAVEFFVNNGKITGENIYKDGGLLT